MALQYGITASGIVRLAKAARAFGSVTVIAPDCMSADAWATACMVMGDSTVKAVMGKRQDLGVMTISADTTSGNLIVWSNATFAGHIQQPIAP